MNPPRAHAPQPFPVIGDCLQVGGVALTRLAERAGRTPFFAYDRGAMTARVAQLRAALPAGIELHYAMKANPMPAVVQHMAALVDGIDVASGGELRTALDTPMAAGRISFAGPGKSDADIACAVAAGAVLVMESPAEMRRVAACGERLGLRPTVMVRVNPDFELKSSGMRMGGGARQFGTDSELVPAMLAELGTLGLDFEGLHIFWGSQNLNPDSICEAHDKTFALAAQLAAAAPGPVRTLNIGGGFGIPYFPGEQRLDLAPISDNLARLLPQASAALPGAKVAIELGRYLVGEAGVYVSRVIERKQSRGVTYLVTDGGLHHHLAASGNFGQVIRKNYPVAIGNRVAGGPREQASVVGPLCTPLDLLADQMDLARADVGDLVVVFQSGAYGLSASPAAFLGHPAAIEIMI